MQEAARFHLAVLKSADRYHGYAFYKKDIPRMEAMYANQGWYQNMDTMVKSLGNRTRN